MKKRTICILLSLLLPLCLLSCGGAANEPEDPAPDFTVTNAQGQGVRLSSLRGRPVVVNFFATWCPPCVHELPYFQAAYEQYGDRVDFMMINVDGSGNDVATALAFMEENGYSFPVYFDLSYEASLTYGVNAIPMTLWVNAEGELVHAYNSMLTEEYLLHYIDKCIE